MITILLQLLLLLFGVCMFKIRRIYKFQILLFSTICLSSVTITFIPFGNMLYFLNLCFFLSEIPYLIKNYKIIKSYPIIPLILMMVIATITLAITSPHYQTPSQWIRLIMFELIGKYFILFHAFLCITTEKMIAKTLNVVYFSTLLLTFFAFLNLILGYSPFLSSISSMAISNEAINTVEAGSTLHHERFRVSSMFFSPFDYGYTCVIILLLSLWGYVKSYISKLRFIVIILCCLFGILFCECRTNYLTFTSSILVYLFLSYKSKTIIKYLFIGLIGIILAFTLIPTFQTKVTEMMTMFDPNSDFKGSSIEMRLLQYSSAIYYMSERPLWGKGKDFFSIDMGWGDEGKSTLLDSDLWGAEGVILIHLLERGIIGTLFYFLFYYGLVKLIFKYRHKDKKTFAICIAIFTAYISMANISGELGSVMPTLLLLGAFTSILYNKKSIKLINKNQK